MKLLNILLICILSLAPCVSSAKESVPHKPVVHTCTKKDTSVKALACNIYFESRGENINGQMAVGFVTLNRLKHESFPQSVRKVVYQKSQFSWTLTAGGGYKVRDADAWKVSVDIAKFLYKVKDNEVLYNKLDPTYGSTYYHAKKVRPSWRKHFTKTITIGNHVFYKEKEERA